ncbi:DNA-binding protein [Gallibacterium anatis]|uniref:DNA-binding protein n=1 Tax=Gallibacterium anatis TaxID=750 RepID=UPI0039FCF11C
MNNPIIIYNTEDGKTRVSLYTQDGTVWLNQNQLAELFATSVSNINKHIANILKEGELSENSVIEYFSITAINGSYYNLVL